MKADRGMHTVAVGRLVFVDKHSIIIKAIITDKGSLEMFHVQAIHSFCNCEILFFRIDLRYAVLYYHCYFSSINN